MGAVAAIAADRAGTVWVSAATGLYRFVNARWERLGARVGLPEDSAVNAFVDRDDALWVKIVVTSIESETRGR